MSINSIIFKKMCARSDAVRDAGLTTPPEIERFDDIQYGNDPKWQVLDVYRPRAEKGRLPVIVSFHGGGWIYGDKNVYQFYCMDLAMRGFAVVNFSYHLAPRHRFPTQFEDANAVFVWLMENAEKYGFDTENIFGVGDSAGAMGIALYSCILTNSEYAKNYSFTPPAGLKIKGLGLNCGIYSMNDPELVGGIKDFIPKDQFPAILPVLNIPDKITSSFPPCYILTGNADFLRNEPDALIKALEKSGVRYGYKLYGDDAHPLGHVFNCNIKSEAAKQANDDECDFLRSLI
ncbi:MAG: alpha/beta hydrolase [Ruminococcus sp.]|uniref:alpha/beta hydrolase n=1 Tax=Ruminococcus sp. TaxID=41978 RepID=UPI0025EB8BE7|nr:alpha/beta hydrolase [Ruminococcus sp.]MCR5601328.1 alpha/beta hydrolase [Ruminococcus sp.]